MKANMLDIKTCAMCGKVFSVLYPNLYRYKRGYPMHYKWLCSWHCLRAFDKREDEGSMQQKRDRFEIAKQLAAEIEAGRNPIEYLEGLGYGNPGQAYGDIKDLMRKHPQLGIDLPNLKPGRAKKKAETPEDVPTVKVSGPIQIQAETPEDVKVMKAPEGGITAMIADEISAWPGYQVAAIRHPVLGEFYFDIKHGFIDWRTEAGDEVSLHPEECIALIEELPKILHVLGVKR